MDQDDKFFAILNSVLELDVFKGHLKWTISDLARKSGMTRTLIYHYFSKDKLEILLESVHFFGKYLAGITDDKLAHYQQQDFIKGIQGTRNILMKFPYIILFYYYHRDKTNEVSQLIRSYESESIQKRKKFFPHLSESEIRTLYALQFGLSLCPNLEEGDLEKSSTLLKVLSDYCLSFV
ncbi:MAG: TetR/AcrR family transcriptional regulator [Halobacteriovoraceae bacterium]|nr:TetR/AcrR family transcriptional regulator [Halobacteriovoraceae bacterium]